MAWRDHLAGQDLAGSTVRRKLSAVSSLFEYLCDKNLVTHNPVAGVEPPKKESGAGKTPVLSDADPRLLLVFSSSSPRCSRPEFDLGET